MPFANIFHKEITYPTSVRFIPLQVDPEQAETEAIQMDEAVCDSVPWGMYHLGFYRIKRQNHTL
jgi:hypothetical protein